MSPTSRRRARPAVVRLADAQAPPKTQEPPAPAYNCMARRRALKAEFGDLRDSVAAALERHDPLALIAEGAPADEYDPEVGTILPRLKEASSVEDLERIVHEEFVRWFDDAAGTVMQYRAVALQIWESWKRYERKAAR